MNLRLLRRELIPPAPTWLRGEGRGLPKEMDLRRLRLPFATQVTRSPRTAPRNPKPEALRLLRIDELTGSIVPEVGTVDPHERPPFQAWKGLDLAAAIFRGCWRTACPPSQLRATCPALCCEPRPPARQREGLGVTLDTERAISTSQSLDCSMSAASFTSPIACQQLHPPRRPLSRQL
jgi:hypothetical protein